MNKKLSMKEYDVLRDVIEQLHQSMEDIKTIRHMMGGFDSESDLEKKIQECRTMIRTVAEGEIKDN